MHLDSLALLRREVGHGCLGLYGAMGYEGRRVVVDGVHYEHALSAHAPSRLEFDLRGRFKGLRCRIAFTDEVTPQRTSATFTLLGDGRTLADVVDFNAGEASRELRVDVSGVDRLTLAVSTGRWEMCHSVWLDPELEIDGGPVEIECLPDCLYQARIRIPTPPQAERCIATIVSPGYAGFLDAMLRSLRIHGNCLDALVAVFVVDGDEECRRVVARHNAFLVDCESAAPISASVKSVLYSAARVINAEKFLCLDADTLVVGDLNPLFQALDGHPADAILAAPDSYLNSISGTLSECLVRFYKGQEADLEFLLDTPAQAADYALIVNDGVFAASRTAMLALDRTLRDMAPRAKEWMDRDLHAVARNQFLFNLVLARLGCGVALDETFNLLPAARDLTFEGDALTVRVSSEGRQATIVHFAGNGRHRYSELRRLFAHEEHDRPKGAYSMPQEGVTEQTARARSEEFIQHIPAYPGHFEGRGIVICAGGTRYFPSAWVCVNVLRHIGCALPIQIWHLGPEEIDERMKGFVKPLGVECVDAYEVRKIFPARILNGWEVKPYAIIHSPFREVLLLDADNLPNVDPEFLFATPQYEEHGAIFWPDRGRLEPDRPIWEFCNVEYRDEPEFESGQVIVDKRRCWEALALTMYFNEHSDFYYHHVHGDKETFHMGFRRMNKSYAMPARGVDDHGDMMMQHDFEGKQIFQHQHKWKLSDANRPVHRLRFAQQCHQYILQLRRLWNGQIGYSSEDAPRKKTDAEREAEESLTGTEFVYYRVGVDARPMTFLPNQAVGVGADEMETRWDIHEDYGEVVLHIYSDSALTCKLRRNEHGIWQGAWVVRERVPVELIPLGPSARPPA